jgi:hypothetical protein
VVRGSCDGSTTGRFDEVAMVEAWGSVGTGEMVGTHKAQRGLLGECDAHTGSETLVGTLQAR